jgi:TRAP-type mannitol/chloroaromatic compound transport system permease small subunit
MIRRIVDTIDTISRYAAVVGGICLGVMSVLMLTEVVCRNYLNFSLVFSWEYSSYLMATVFFLTAGFTLLVKGHVRVFLLAEALPKKVNYVLEVIATAMGMFIAGFVTYALADFTYQSFIRGARTFLPSETLLWPPQAVITLGAFLLTLQIFARLVRLLIGEEPDLTLSQDELPE